VIGAAHAAWLLGVSKHTLYSILEGDPVLRDQLSYRPEGMRRLVFTKQLREWAEGRPTAPPRRLRAVEPGERWP
jgi:hypothetical protein